MKVLVGLDLDGPTFTEEPIGRARLGAPIWGPIALLRDLELRLGIPDDSIPRSMRVPRFVARIRRLDDEAAFYRRSFAVDPIGTGAALLSYRDALVEGGWKGESIRGGGERLDALARLERGEDEPVPKGDSDRLARVLEECGRSSRIYDELVLADDRSDWPGVWSAIFGAMAHHGTTISAWSPALPGAPVETDLGRLQRSLVGSALESAKSPDHDGSIVMLRGETPTEVAALTASLLATDSGRPVVVRSGDAYPLDAALEKHGLAGQGTRSASAWRPAMQVLPLAIELAFEPRDPSRALELLTLPVGPFRGIVGSRLARAVARAPGIGGREWLARREEARERLLAKELRRLIDTGVDGASAQRAAERYVTTRLQRVAEWLETEGSDPRGAPKEAIVDVAQRVRSFLLTRMDDEHDIYGPAFAQAHAFVEALAHEERVVLSREETRQLLDTLVRSSHDHSRTAEQAGRIPHVGTPAAILAPCDTVILWSFVADVERATTSSPWNRAEREALRTHGVILRDPSRELRRKQDGWRRAVLAARKRIVFVVPASLGGRATHPHSMWDEISARLSLERMPAWDTRDLLERRSALVPVEELAPLPLPDSPGSWSVPSETIVLNEVTELGSATALDALVTCPLRWVLEERAELRSGAVTRISGDAQLCGNLGHRLIEELFLARAFEMDERACLDRASGLLSSLMRLEAATLLLSGMAFERAQLVPQLLRAVRELHRFLTMTGSRIVAVEEAIETDTPIGKLTGRLDLRIDARGSAAVVDLKWGESRYRKLIERGRAIQLAIYARSIGDPGDQTLPAAAYFALRSGRLMTADARLTVREPLRGPSLSSTWERVERTARAVAASLERGTVPVAANRAARPLLDGLGIPENEHDDHLAPDPTSACDYCSCAAICGRGWEPFR